MQCSAVQCCGVSCRVVSLFVCRHRCVSCVVKKTRSHVHDGSKKKKKISEIVHKLPRKGFISIAVLKNSKTIHPQKLRLLQFQSHHVSSVISSAWMVELPVTAPLHHRPTVPQPHHTAHTYLQHPFQDYLWPCSVRLHHPTSRCWSIPKNSRTSTSRRTHTYLVVSSVSEDATQKPSATTTACFCQQSPAARRSSYPQVSLHVRSTKLFIHTTCAIPNLLLHTKWICILPTTHRGMCFCIIAALLTHDITCAISLSDHAVPTCSVLNLSTALSTAHSC